VPSPERPIGMDVDALLTIVRVGELARIKGRPGDAVFGGETSILTVIGWPAWPRVDLPAHPAAANPVPPANPRASFARLAPSTARWPHVPIIAAERAAGRLNPYF